MSSSLRYGLLFASLIALIFVLVSVVKKKLNIKYSIVWLLWALMSFLMAAFPSSFYIISRLLGIQMPVNTVFLIMITLLYALTFYVYLMLSKNNEEIIRLTYKVSALEKELNEFKKKNER
jgi:hypothetical protein